MPVIGNLDRRWYTFKHHIPIIDKVQYKSKYFYKIAAPTVAVAVDPGKEAEESTPTTSDQKGALGVQAAIGDDTNTFAFMNGLNELEKLKFVDVFFLVDATKSMGPYIDQVFDVIKHIQSSLEKKSGWKGTTFRYGFRVYRDTYDKVNCKKGVCEGLPLNSKNCTKNVAEDNSWESFLSEFSKIKATPKDIRNRFSFFTDGGTNLSIGLSIIFQNKVGFLIRKRIYTGQDIFHGLTPVDDSPQLTSRYFPEFTKRIPH